MRTLRWVLIAVGGLLLIVSPAMSAPAQNADILRCKQSPSLETRVACLEDAIRRVTGTAPTSGDPAAAAREHPVETELRPVDTAGDEPGDATADNAVDPASAGKGIQRQPAAKQPPAEKRAAGRTVPGGRSADRASELDRFGEEQLTRTQSQAIEAGERYAAQVTAFEFVGRNKLRVRLANGQVWQQNNSDRPNLYRSLRDVETFGVEMWRTSHGTYRMYIPEASRTLRVQRLK